VKYYCKQRFSGSGSVWHGSVLDGFAGIVELCGRINAPEAVLCKDRPKITAACVGGCFVKRYNLPGFLTRLRRRFKRPRPQYALDGAIALGALHIATPKVVAALVETRGLSLRREYLVTGLLTPDDRQFSSICAETDRKTAWQLLLDKVIPPVRRMHDAGWMHGDLSLRNVYLPENAPEAGFIDLDGMRRRGKALPERYRTIEAARLVSSFLHYSCDTADAARLALELTARYNSCGTDKITPEAVFAAMKPMMRRVEKYIEIKKKQLTP
jgi:hypothetical protein